MSSFANLKLQTNLILELHMATYSVQVTVQRNEIDGSVLIKCTDQHAVAFLSAMHKNAALFDVRLFGHCSPSWTSSSTDYKPPAAGCAVSRTHFTVLKPIYGHKAILGAISARFAELFTSTRYATRSVQDIHTRDDIEHESLRQIVQLLYTGELLIPTAAQVGSHLQRILVTAKYLVMHDLASACEHYLTSSNYLNKTTFLDLWLFARWHKCESLQKAVDQFISDKVIQQTDFLQLAFAELVDFLTLIDTSNDGRLIESIADLRCEIATAWLDHSPHDRKQYAEQLIKLVQVECMSHAALVKASCNKVLKQHVTLMMYESLQLHLLKLSSSPAVSDPHFTMQAKKDNASVVVQSPPHASPPSRLLLNKQSSLPTVKEEDVNSLLESISIDSISFSPASSEQSDYFSSSAILNANQSASSSVFFAIGGSSNESRRNFCAYSPHRTPSGPNNSNWRMLQPLPWSRWWANACCVQGHIFMLGGCKNGQWTSDIDIYNVKASNLHDHFDVDELFTPVSLEINDYNQWTTLKRAKLLKPRSAHACVATSTASGDYNIYVLGGWDSNFDPVETCEKISCSAALEEKQFENHRRRRKRSSVYCDEERGKGETRSSTIIAPMLTVRNGPAAVSLSSTSGDAVLVMGGELSVSRYANSVERYDDARDLWSVVGFISHPRSSGAAAVVGDDVYFVGGFGANGAVNVVEAFNLNRGRCRTATGMTTARDNCVVWSTASGSPVDNPHVLYAFGGHDGQKALQSIEMYDTRTGKWLLLPPTNDLPVSMQDGAGVGFN